MAKANVVGEAVVRSVHQALWAARIALAGRRQVRYLVVGGN